MKITPMMEQYLEIKSKFRDSILLFRLGDFYEAFFDDAKIISKTLQLVLTSRNGNEMAGIPYHALETYLKKLVKSGFKVAICDQVEDPSKAVGIVRREVTRVITPGTVVEDSLLESGDSSYLAAVVQSEAFFLLILDISTGESIILIKENWEEIQDSLKRYNAVQFLSPESKEWEYRLSGIKKAFPSLYTESLPGWYFNPSESIEQIKRIFKIENIDFLEFPPEAVALYGAVLKYLEYQHMGSYRHLSYPKFISDSSSLILDSVTIDNLNLFPANKNEKGKNLFDVLNSTKTPMGSRKLKEWMLSPLRDIEKIKNRNDHIRELNEAEWVAEEISKSLSAVYDLERIISRLSYKKATPKDLVSLNRTLKTVPPLRESLEGFGSFNDIYSLLEPPIDLMTFLDSAIEEEPQGSVGEGKTIKTGFNTELDEYRDLLCGGDEKLQALEEKERKKTGITNLKIKKNNVFGYFIEISKGNLSKVPQEYERKQTLVSSERFISPELKPLEEKMFRASGMIETLEREIFSSVVGRCLEFIEILKSVSEGLSLLDVYISLTAAARENNYTEPVFTTQKIISIEMGRHPVVEKSEGQFIPNSITLENENRFIILTGPNMSGKSTYLRQTALICLMAQMGSFVPAKKALLPVLDRIFTRIGARDDLAQGRSTFLIEMSETASIINNATDKSLVILDEVGRGTSTYDGISIAWVVSEYIFNAIGAFCIFATHYNELTELANVYPGIKNLMVRVEETGDEVVFLHSVGEGIADKSYGIAVAKIAGLPDEIVERAYKVLETITEEKKLDERIRVLGKDQIEEMKKRTAHMKKIGKKQMSFLE